MFPLATFDAIPLAEANALLARWGHEMGPLARGFIDGQACYALVASGAPRAVVTHSTLIRDHVGGGATWLTRDNTIELSRLCAENRWANRVALRLWRECVFPGTGTAFAISYQDAQLHTGATYRNDGWTRLGYSSSGTDQRTGKKGRRKWIWGWSHLFSLPDLLAGGTIDAVVPRQPAPVP